MEQTFFPKAVLGPALLMGSGVWVMLLSLVHFL